MQHGAVACGAERKGCGTCCLRGGARGQGTSQGGQVQHSAVICETERTGMRACAGWHGQRGKDQTGRPGTASCPCWRRDGRGGGPGSSEADRNPRAVAPLQYWRAMLPANIALQYCPPILPSNIAPQYCPPILPAQIARQYCRAPPEPENTSHASESHPLAGCTDLLCLVSQAVHPRNHINPQTNNHGTKKPHLPA